MWCRVETLRESVLSSGALQLSESIILQLQLSSHAISFPSPILHAMPFCLLTLMGIPQTPFPVCVNPILFHLTPTSEQGCCDHPNSVCMQVAVSGDDGYEHCPPAISASFVADTDPFRQSLLP